MFWLFLMISVNYLILNKHYTLEKMYKWLKIELSFLAHLAFRPCELLSTLFVRRPSSVRQHFTF
jgi:hypothetical protein